MRALRRRDGWRQFWRRGLTTGGGETNLRLERRVLERREADEGKLLVTGRGGGGGGGGRPAHLLAVHKAQVGGERGRDGKGGGDGGG